MNGKSKGESKERREFQGKVAVVTGAASGIGRALATRFAHEGMKVVLADVEEAPLKASVQELKDEGHDVIGVLTDVSKAESVNDLAKRTLEAYGGVHILCNNAGVGDQRDIVRATSKDWDWVLWRQLLGSSARYSELLARHDRAG